MLSSEGVLLVSTPDRAVYSEANDYRNPFHVRELSRPEFADLLGGHFDHVAIATQLAAAGSSPRATDPPALADAACSPGAVLRKRSW